MTTTIYSLSRDVISYIKGFLDYKSYAVVLKTAWLFHTPDEEQHFRLYFFKMITRYNRPPVSRPAPSPMMRFIGKMSMNRITRRLSTFLPAYYENWWDRLSREEKQEHEEKWGVEWMLYEQRQANNLIATTLFGEWIIDRNAMPRRPFRVSYSIRNKLGEDVEVVDPAYFRAMNEWIKDMQAHFLQGLRKHGIKISYLH